MLFLNRRGYAGFVSCRSCGHVMKCPHCDVSLSEHNGRKLICHYCGYETVKPDKCPVCSSPYIGGFKAGTQQIQQVVEKEFPEARVLRMDYDTTRAKGSYEKILSAFSRHEADILIGTQMIVKGHERKTEFFCTRKVQIREIRTERIRPVWKINFPSCVRPRE